MIASLFMHSHLNFSWIDILRPNCALSIEVYNDTKVNLDKTDIRI